MREKILRRRILDRLNALPGCYARGIAAGPLNAGWPDIVGSFKGSMLALEVKTPTGHATKLQTAEIARWQKAGAIAGIVRSWEEALDLILKNRY